MKYTSKYIREALMLFVWGTSSNINNLSNRRINKRRLKKHINNMDK